ncbi:glutaredoxin domain-containing protein [Mesorhizobium sp. M8A.F.Ca.ET.021.01.1.1]|uniref:glutaredoxin domain-containing protein n=1 Tax=Mesorhizobium sp. M8A.F.Ca.ET.021.01.1.1 TaxID=2496757 RepID=UPI000FCAD005|nr:glutaredoxin domain-containing protein [Mesorhizobium sp. M8A.F.Ca.ET.021.01.1.1]RUW57180.1 glutaredoxin [Mesorhizobium sp. M8A.F.Ca.ET.021.01.1.1]
MNFKIVTQDNCPHCVRAKDLIMSKGSTYEETNISALPELVRSTFKAQYKTVPQVFLEGELIGGADALEIWYANR